MHWIPFRIFLQRLTSSIQLHAVFKVSCHSGKVMPRIKSNTILKDVHRNPISLFVVEKERLRWKIQDHNTREMFSVGFAETNLVNISPVIWYIRRSVGALRSSLSLYYTDCNIKMGKENDNIFKVTHFQTIGISCRALGKRWCYMHELTWIYLNDYSFY